MIFTETSLPEAYLIELEHVDDERGFFARAWCSDEFKQHGLVNGFVQCNISFNTIAGTLRGMHFQIAPYPEVKVVRCTMGAIYDVIVDLRPNSPAFKQWYGVTLSADNRLMYYIPDGCAHGFVTLTDKTEVFYQMSEFYHPECARGVRWNDPAFDIRWPLEPRVISMKDQQYGDLGL